MFTRVSTVAVREWPSRNRKLVFDICECDLTLTEH